MALTNADKQTRWRKRNAVALTATAEAIAKRLIEALDESKLRRLTGWLSDYLQSRPCPHCDGSGERYIKAWKSCTSKKCDTSPPFPCPTCRPAEYFVASGGELRNQGRYAEALNAAMEVCDYWSAGDTLVKWQASPKQVQAAGGKVSLRTIARLWKIARCVPPGERKNSWQFYNETGVPSPVTAKLTELEAFVFGKELGIVYTRSAKAAEIEYTQKATAA
jgi:hypothetical protein